MQIVMWETERLVPYTANPRRNDHAVALMAAAIKEFGFRVPILARRSGEIVDGHMRHKAARLLDLATVPVILCDDWTETQVKAFRIAVNKSAEWAEWDTDLLAVELSDLQSLGSDLSATGFTKAEFSPLLEHHGLQISPDDVPPIPKNPITGNGDLWILGDHRLLCGSSTHAEDVARVMNGERGMVMATDPPYGITYDTVKSRPGASRKSTSWEKIINDDLDGESLRTFLESVFRQAKALALAPSAAWYIWHPNMHHTASAFFAAAESVDVLHHCQIIWVKPRIIFGFGCYHWQHESCLMGWVRGQRPPFYGARNQATVWNVDYDGKKNAVGRVHPAQKPVGLFTPPILNHCRAGEIAFEPFSGSGSQIIAAEMLGRKCYAIEIAPGFCDVAVARWEQATGKKARRIKGG